MNVLHVTSTDPAGSVHNFVQALNAHGPDVRARAITTMRNEVYDFQGDTTYVFDCGDEIEALLRAADVVHLHKVRQDFEISVPLAKNRLVRRFRVADHLNTKRVIYHLHGHPYERANVAENAAGYLAAGASVVLAATPDLADMYRPHLGDRVRYFPNLVPVNDVRYLPRATNAPVLMADGSRKFLLGQSPTDSVLKNVHMVHDLVERLGKTWPVVYIKISQMSHDLALRHKRNCALVFDHMQGYYGLSSLEALSMGKPTLAGLSDATVAAICDFFGVKACELPWQVTRTERGLEYAITDLLGNEQFRKELGVQSREFMERIWSDANVAQRLAEVYRAL